MIDFAALIAAIPSGVPLVWELNSRASKGEIINALARWKQTFARLNNSSL
jgi:hypothetical protein